MLKLIFLSIPFSVLVLAGCATQRNLTTLRAPSSEGASSVTPAQVTLAYTSVSKAIQALKPQITNCGPGFNSSDTCYQGKDGCSVVVSYVPAGMLSAFVDAAKRPPFPSQCYMTLISPSHTIQSLTTQTSPYVIVKAVTATTPDASDGPKTTDPCSIQVQQNTVTVTMGQESTSCALGD